MVCGRLFEGEFGGGVVTSLLDFANERMAGAIEELLNPRDLGAVLVVGAALEARRETHLHFGVDAAGETGVGMKVLDAAAHFEKIEGVVQELFGSGSGGEWTVVDGSSAETRKPR